MRALDQDVKDAIWEALKVTCLNGWIPILLDVPGEDPPIEIVPR